MKNIQSLTLVMMVVMVYTKAIHNDLLEQIHENAKQLYKLPKNGRIMVAEISTTQNGPCVKEFFCLAEKALVNATHSFKNETKETRETMEKLKRSLHSYNNQHGHGHNCTLNPNSKYHLEKFLEQVIQCSSHKRKRM